MERNNLLDNYVEYYKMEKDLIKNFSISGREESLEKMLSTLKFIAKVREGEKIDVKTITIVKPDLPSRAYRTIISRQSRIETLDFIKTAINKAVNMVYYYLSLEEDEKIITNKINFNLNVAKVIMVNLVESKKGINNLVVTYEEDRKFVTDLETIVETMEIKIQGKNKLFNDKDENNGLVVD